MRGSSRIGPGVAPCVERDPIGGGAHERGVIGPATQGLFSLTWALTVALNPFYVVPVRHLHPGLHACMYVFTPACLHVFS